MEENLRKHIEGVLADYERKPGMRELIIKLREVSDSYMAFVAAIATYAQKKPERLAAVMDIMDSSEPQTTSDIIRFISEQPDFYEDRAELQYEEKESKKE